MATVASHPSTSHADKTSDPKGSSGGSSMSWWAMLKQTGADWLEDKAMKLAASLALYTMLSIAPLLVIVTKIVGIIYREKTTKQIEQVMAGIMPGLDTAMISQMIKNAGQPGSGIWATVLSTVIAIFGATGVFGELQDSMNTIWEVKPKPNMGIWGFIRTRFLSLAMVLGIAFLFMVSTVGTTLITTLGDTLSGGNRVVAYILSTIVSLGLMTLLFALIFKLLPDAKTRWKDVWVGAALTAVLFEIGKHALAWYLGSTKEVYGAAASLAALLLWIYYSAQILFFGAEFTQVWAKAHGHEIQPSSHAVKVTEEDRAKQGMASPERIAAKTTEQEGRGGSPSRTKTYPAPSRPTTPRQPALAAASATGDGNGHGGSDAKTYALAAGGAVLGAIVAGIGVGRYLNDPDHLTSREIAQTRLNDRLHKIERKLGRVSLIKQYLADMAVADRIDKVEKEIRRAGRHIRAKETNRPLWMVRLGDLVGGRWSNLS